MDQRQPWGSEILAGDDRSHALYLLDREITKRRRAMTIDDLIEDLRKTLSNTWDSAVREALVDAINKLEAMTGPISMVELDLLERGIQEILGRPLDQVLRSQIFDLQAASYLLGAQEAIGAGIDIAWGIADQRSLTVLNSNTMFWIESYYDDNIQEGLKALLQDYFDGGYDRKSLAGMMKQHFSELGDKGDQYWDLFADHTATKVREIGRVSGYRQAGVTVVRIKAKIDDRTSEICRRLHGHVIAVDDLQRQVDNYLSACETKDKEQIKEAWPWWSDKQAEKLTSKRSINRRIKRSQIGLPPYHGRCRTITVAEYHVAQGDNKFFDL